MSRRGKGIRARHAQPEIPILAEGQRFVEGAAAREDLAPEHRGAGEHPAVEQELVVDPARELGVDVVRRARCVEALGAREGRTRRRPAPEQEAAEDDARLGMLGHHLELARQLVRIPVVVVVEQADEFAARLADAVVARAADAGVALRDQPHPGIVGAHDLRRAVGGAIVHHQHLEVCHRLGEHAGQRLADVGLAVVAGDDDADAGHATPARRRKGRSARASRFRVQPAKPRSVRKLWATRPRRSRTSLIHRRL